MVERWDYRERSGEVLPALWWALEAYKAGPYFNTADRGAEEAGYLLSKAAQVFEEITPPEFVSRMRAGLPAREPEPEWGLPKGYEWVDVGGNGFAYECRPAVGVFESPVHSALVDADGADPLPWEAMVLFAGTVKVAAGKFISAADAREWAERELRMRVAQAQGRGTNRTAKLCADGRAAFSDVELAGWPMGEC